MSQRPWTASYGKIPREIDPHRYPSVLHLLEAAIQRFGERPAFHAFGSSLSFSDVADLSARFAAYLQAEAGVKKGDRVAVMLPNIPSFPIAFMAICRIGAIQVNVNPLYTARELEHQLNDSGAEVIVILDEAVSTLDRIVGNTSVRRVIRVAPQDCMPAAPEVSLPAEDASTGVVSMAGAIEKGAHLRLLPVELSSEDLLFLQYTGGTTGPAKGAALSHGNLIANIEQFQAFMPEAMRPGQEVVITAIPLYHIFALMVNFLCYFSVGAVNWLVSNPRDLDGLVGILEEARPTVMTGVNTLYAALPAHPRWGKLDLSQLRMSIGGGAAVMKSTSDRWLAATGCFILEGYGLSETSPVITVNPSSAQEFSGTAGMPVPSTDVKLLDAQDDEVRAGEAGEICVRGPQVMRGYWQKPDENAKAFTPDGYFRTGDIGVFDQRCFLQIVDRKKDMIIVSGFNVYPNEVEAVAAACAGVAECACIGVPDERTGEAVVLYAVRKPGAELSMQALQAHCRRELAAYKVPRQILFVELLPKSTVGKILRRELRQQP